MNEFETEYIAKVVEIMQNNEITEVTLEDVNKSIVIRGNGYKPVIKQKTVEQPVQTVEEVKEIIEEQLVETKKNLVPIVSNMIGIFYAKPSPDAEPFISVGDEIKEGQTVCIIEMVKLMNKISSEVSGKVVEICIEDGKPVEYGQVIMYVEKN
jgi:acetyl-CoA carboxylase biotin carboxyl carrier protein